MGDRVYPGFVVNIYDPLNYDIDVILPDSMKFRYSDVFGTKYHFIDENGTRKTGVALRCRLRGINFEGGNRNISLRRLINSDPTVHAAYVRMTQTFDRMNGWVLCRIIDVDSYNRLLVDLFDPITGANLGSQLLSFDFKRNFRSFNMTPR